MDAARSSSTSSGDHKGLTYADENLFPSLRLRELTGYYCPGCGGTRACAALLQGKIVKSFLCHPVVLYTAVIYGWYMITHTIEYLTRGKLAAGMRYRDLYLYLAAAIILIQWVVRNLLKLIWGIDIL